VRRPSLLAVAALAAACASAPPKPAAPVAFTDSPFALDGRLSARRDQQGAAVHFTWVHATPKDDLEVSTPLGQVVAELHGDAAAQQVTLVRADGTTEQAADWRSLTERALGFALPVEGLAAWARGAPHPGSAFARDTDSAGRTSLLRQDGWEITYDYGDESAQPKRMRLTFGDLEVRIVADRWREP
jgi:outer membrane lipoprotein LolB